MSKLMLAICAAATLAGAVLASGYLSPAAAVISRMSHQIFNLSHRSRRDADGFSLRLCRPPGAGGRGVELLQAPLQYLPRPLCGG